ncbi:serine--tRNA ligase [Granulicella arctica]|uniref:Serine--tRNA ligase n=1 Tax=Granulicella arctica TaxID=940613 RepID=A0A7Y9TLG3_9BACT|nr:serine--tRNA ligase [Granulicella arctica]NYF80097.1 seryl-tRNA synthetase [Granulicella arctica]
MIDLGFVRANLPLVEEKLRARGADPAVVLKDFAEIDRERREAITQVETLKAERNRLTEQIAALRRSGGDASGPTEETKALKSRVEELEGVAAAADERLREMMQTLPNLPMEDVPVGRDEHGNREEKVWGEKPAFDFAAKAHWEIGEALGILDFERAAKISGSRFVVHFGQGARLERALANFMIDLHTREHGYTEVLPPNMVNRDSLYGTGQLPKFEEDLFKIPTDRFEQDRYHSPVIGEKVYALGQNGKFRVNEVVGQNVTIELIGVPSHLLVVPRGVLSYRRNFYLIPTAEVPVTNLYRDEVLDEGHLTTSFCAYTPCYRSEAGSYGKDVRGMIRQHQFQKVELVKFTKPEDSAAEHEALTRHAETVLERLELPYRRMLLCTGDMGFSAAKTYDLEVWLPGQGLYREISSCSNFEAFQARRANIRYRPAGQKKSEFVHTLNGSGLAIGRTYLAVLENYQQADGTVRVPDVLVPYMNGETVIGKQAGKR